MFSPAQGMVAPAFHPAQFRANLCDHDAEDPSLSLASTVSAASLARGLAASETTIRRWGGRSGGKDRSPVRHNPGQATSPLEEATLAELRSPAGLSLDHITKLMNRCINPRL